jgi:hypothetical protein
MSRARWIAFIIDGSPQPELLSANDGGYLIEMPLRCRPMAPTAKLTGEQRPEF